MTFFQSFDLTYAGRSKRGGQIVRGFDFEAPNGKPFRIYISDEDPNFPVFVTVYQLEAA